MYYLSLNVPLRGSHEYFAIHISDNFQASCGIRAQHDEYRKPTDSRSMRLCV
jgi:hypothetical protein